MKSLTDQRKTFRIELVVTFWYIVSRDPSVYFFDGQKIVYSYTVDSRIELMNNRSFLS